MPTANKPTHFRGVQVSQSGRESCGWSFAKLTGTSLSGTRRGHVNRRRFMLGFPAHGFAEFADDADEDARALHGRLVDVQQLRADLHGDLPRADEFLQPLRVILGHKRLGSLDVVQPVLGFCQRPVAEARSALG